MKRLLAYLFIVLGLGLAVNNFAFAQCLGNCSNGYGMFTWPGGSKYVGGWKKGEKHGQGTFTFTDGGKYIGGWVNDKIQGQGTLIYPNGHKYVGEFKDDGTRHGQGTYTWPDGTKYVGEYRNNDRHGQGTFTSPDESSIYVGGWVNDKIQGQGTFKYADGRIEKGIWDNGELIKPNNIQTKIAKVEEPKQEEFKPVDKDIDNDPPVIEIAEAITVNDSDYEFEGKVTDKSKQIFVEVDGRLVDVKKGKFTVKGYSPVDKEISIEAIDGYGNRSKPKIVKLIIDIKDTVVAEKLEPLNPSTIKAKVSKDKVALIIGIENYENSPKAKFANLDAKYFFDYARKGFGVKKKNINLLIDEDANLAKTNSAIFKWLPSKIKKNQTDLIIFFSGHGLASDDGKQKFILPYNADPDLLSRTALSRKELFDEIVKLKPKSVTMFFDTCYSGVTRDEEMLLALAKPLRIVADDENKIPENFTIFTASKPDQISSGLKEAKHGIFSYYLMKGLEGKADSDNDYKITNGELLAYMDQNVSEKALDLGRQQNPSLAGNPDQVLMRYR
jgi:hypothetical protein